MLEELKTRIRCYKNCIYNSFHKSNCGYCMKKEIQLTNEGCMDFSDKLNKDKRGE